MMKRSHLKVALFALLSALTAEVSHAGPRKMLSGGLTLMAGAAANTAETEASGHEEAGLAPVAVPVADGGADGGVRSGEADECLRRSDSHFNAGRQLYFEGDLAGARKEFDLAVDALLRVSDSLPDHGRIERRLDEICNLIYRFDVEKLGAGQKADEEKVAFDEAPIDAISQMTFGVDEKARTEAAK